MGKGNKNFSGDGEEGGEEGGGESRVQNSPKAFGELKIIFDNNIIEFSLALFYTRDVTEGHHI